MSKRGLGDMMHVAEGGAMEGGETKHVMEGGEGGRHCG